MLKQDMCQVQTQRSNKMRYPIKAVGNYLLIKVFGSWQNMSELYG